MDNSFDADANRVSIGFPKAKTLVISDDGVGCSDLSRLYIMGDRLDHVSTDIGHYGYGCTQSMVWLWGVAHIASRTSRGDGKEITINWDKVAASLDWDYGEEQAVADMPVGTTLLLTTCRQLPSVDRLRHELAKTYSPAIERGKQILFSRGTARPSPLSAIPLPALEQVEEADFDVCGKSASLRIGVVKEGEPNPFRGISFERTYRVIKSESALGAGDYGVSRIAGRVYLSRDWRLSTNKDDFAELEEELGEEIHRRCRHIFEAAASQCVDVEFAAFNRELDAILNETLSVQKERRTSPDEPQTGTVVPKDTGRKRTRASKVQPGEGSVRMLSPEQRTQRSGFKLEWLSLDGLTVGDYDDSSHRVRLNLSNPFMAQMRKEGNKWAVAAVIFLILADYNQRQADSKRPLFKLQDRALLPTLGTALVDAMQEPQKLAGVA